MTAGQDGSGDVRDLLGLQTVAAKVIIVAYVLTFLLLAVATAPGYDAWWAELLAWALVSAGAVTLIHYPGDPLPLWVGIGLTMIGPAALGLVLAVIPVPIDGLLQTWPLGAATAIYTYMCVRGRTILAWIGMVATLAVCAVWAELTGQGAGHGIAISAINLAPLLMSTFFSWTIRPAARDIYELREQTTIQVAAEAGDLAVLEERERQLHRLDELARPLLERITAGEDLSDNACIECRLLEARLRDTLRAPVLTAPNVVEAAWAARAREVEVILLDDHGMNDSPEEVRDRILEAVADLLCDAASGMITVRVLPPRRKTLVTVLHDDDNTVRRFEFGHDGTPLARQHV